LRRASRYRLLTLVTSVDLKKFTGAAYCRLLVLFPQKCSNHYARSELKKYKEFLAEFLRGEGSLWAFPYTSCRVYNRSDSALMNFAEQDRQLRFLQEYILQFLVANDLKVSCVLFQGN